MQSGGKFDDKLLVDQQPVPIYITEPMSVPRAKKYVWHSKWAINVLPETSIIFQPDCQDLHQHTIAALCDLVQDDSKWSSGNERQLADRWEAQRILFLRFVHQITLIDWSAFSATAECAQFLEGVDDPSITKWSIWTVWATWNYCMQLSEKESVSVSQTKYHLRCDISWQGFSRTESQQIKPTDLHTHCNMTSCKMMQNSWRQRGYFAIVYCARHSSRSSVCTKIGKRSLMLLVLWKAWTGEWSPGIVHADQERLEANLI